MGRSHLAGVVAAALLVLIAGVLAVVGAGGGSEDPSAASEPQLVTAAGLGSIESKAGHAVYWAGVRNPLQLEATVQPDAGVLLRYLPPEVEAGDRPGDFLTVGSYPLPGALDATRRAAAEAKATVHHLPGGGIAFQDPEARRSAYLAFPGSDVQVEVYDPQPGKALSLIRAGAIEPASE